jgi:aminopeptidase
VADQTLVNYADILVNYSLEARPGETVLVRSHAAGAPLVKEVYAALVKAGAHARVSLTIEELESVFYRHASEVQLDHLSEIDRFEAEHTDAMIRITAPANTRWLAGVDPAKETRRMLATRPIQDIVLTKVRWALCVYPTPALAQEADMTLDDYAAFVYGATWADDPEGAKRWRELSRSQQELTERLQSADKVRIVGPGTDIEISTKGRTWINSDGRHNMPSGEVFTAPIETSAKGEITFTYPAIYRGREVQGIRLLFTDGVVTEATAEKGGDFLEKMLDTDAGSRRLGEIGIGTNYRIDRFTKSILFDEKIGGSVHFALGRAYKDECGGGNDSAIHWDMILDLKEGGEIVVDGETIQRNGRFLVGGL